MNSPYEPFAVFAGIDMSRWRLLKALDVQHRGTPRLDGFVSNVYSTSCPPSRDSIVVKVHYGGNDVREYSAAGFLRVHSYVGFRDQDLEDIFGGLNPGALVVSPKISRPSNAPAPEPARAGQVAENSIQPQSVSGSALGPHHLSRYVFHMTMIENLPFIAKEGRLLSSAGVRRRGLTPKSIAYEDLKAKRSKRCVTVEDTEHVCCFRPIGDFVPFYFCTKTPMLYAILKGNVRAELSQHDIAFLAARISTAVRVSSNWCFTDGHAVERATRMYTRVEDLERVDWRTVDADSWNASLDLDVKRRRQAEFLVLEHYPFAEIEIIAGKTRAAARKIQATLECTSYHPNVEARPEWYFQGG